MKRLIIAIGGVLALMLGGLSLSASATASAAAGPGDVLKITHIGTDAMGTDSFANRNREFVTFKNNTGADFDIDGVVVEDSWSKLNTHSHSCNKYVITSLPGQGDNAVLKAGEYVTVFNGSRWPGNYRHVDGSTVEYRLYAKSDVDCGTAGHYLNNDADTVYVTKSDAVFDSKSWDWGGGYSIRY